MISRRILVIAATDLSDGNSASLCHTAYIRGFIDAGHEVDVISVKPSAHQYKHEIPGAKYIYYSDENILVKYARKRRKIDNVSRQTSISDKRDVKIKTKLRKSIINRLGASATWIRRASSFRKNTGYDLVLSLSSPPHSHIVANKLKRGNRIAAHSWCQLWEDPWSTDLYNVDYTVAEKEARILNDAEKILYVSPLTLERQKALFEDNKEKMDWLPLPTYYTDNSSDSTKGIAFGYFGQYFPNVRNIRPVYEALESMDLPFYICGEPHDLLQSSSTTKVFKRMSPDKLRKYEDSVNVLVFVANKGGGQIPGKIYQYSGTNKAILFVLDGNEHEKKILRDYFGNFDRYYFAENEIESIKEAVKRIIEDYNNKKTYNPVEFFRAENIVSELLKKTL